MHLAPDKTPVDGGRLRWTVGYVKSARRNPSVSQTLPIKLLVWPCVWLATTHHQNLIVSLGKSEKNIRKLKKFSCVCVPTIFISFFSQSFQDTWWFEKNRKSRRIRNQNLHNEAVQERLSTNIAINTYCQFQVFVRRQHSSQKRIKGFFNICFRTSKNAALCFKRFTISTF